MDTLFWTQLSPTVKIKYSKKQFYNKFLYKLVMLVPAAHIIRDEIKEPQSNADINIRIAQYNKYSQTRRFYGQYVKSSDKRRQLADEKQINQYIKFVKHRRDQLHLRYEMPWLSVYSNDLEMLKTLARMDRENIIGFYGPRDADAHRAIERGEIITKRISDYDFKIFLKEMTDISLEEKQSIISCLDNMGEVVKLTKHCRKSLENPFRWLAASYFYTRDDGVITMLNLIKPGIVQGIFKLSLQSDK